MMIYSINTKILRLVFLFTFFLNILFYFPLLAFQTEFDSEIEKEVRNTLINSYTSKELPIDDIIKKFEHYDANLFIHYGYISGLKDNIIEIRNNMIKNRDDFFISKRASLKTPEAINMDKVQKSMILQSLYNDELNSIKRLSREDRLNRLFSFFNLCSQTISRVLMGQTEAVFQFFIDSLFISDRLTKLTPQENKIAHLINCYQSKYPDSKLTQKFQEKLNRIEEKKKRDLFKKEIIKGDYFLAQQDLSNALNCYNYALTFFPENKKVNKRILKAEKLLTKLSRDRYKSLIVLNSEDVITNQKEEEAYKDLLIAASLRDPDIIEHLTNNFFRIYTSSSLCDEAKYLLAIAYDIQGNKEKAFDRLNRLANEEEYSNMKYHTQMLLKSLEYNPYEAFWEENKKFNKQTTQYVLTGQRPYKTSLHLTLSSAVFQRAGAFANLGAFFVLDMAIRAIAVNFKNPIEFDQLTSIGDRVLKKSHDETEKETVLFILAKREEKAGNFHKAIEYLNSSVYDYSQEIQKLQNKLAKNIYLYAKDNKDTKEKERAFSFLIDKFPSSKYTKLAQEELAKLSLPAKSDIKIDKKLLSENTILTNSENLNIDPALLDGYIENNELSNAGLIIKSDNTVTMKIDKYKGGSITVRHEIDSEKRERVANIHKNIIATKDLEAVEPTQFKTWVPFEISGGIGETGISLYPHLSEIKLKKEEEDLYK